MRFKISELLLFTAFVAGAFACMRSPAYFTSSLYVSAILLTLLMSLVMAIAIQNERRIFWICFSACGLIYAYNADLSLNAEWAESREYLVTGTLVETLYDRVHGDRFPTPSSRGGGIFSVSPDVYASGGSQQTGGLGRGGGLGGGGGIGYTESQGSFLIVGHALIAICLAWLGGHLGFLIQKRSTTTNKSPVD